MIRADGSLSLIRSGSTVMALKRTVGKTIFYGYYGGVYIAKNLAFDANGKTLIGYGPIGSDGQNRSIQEVSVRHRYHACERSEVGCPEPDVPILVCAA